MWEQKYTNIKNLFNGDMQTFSSDENALGYIRTCVARQVPISIEYGYKKMLEADRFLCK